MWTVAATTAAAAAAAAARRRRRRRRRRQEVPACAAPSRGSVARRDRRWRSLPPLQHRLVVVPMAGVLVIGDLGGRSVGGDRVGVGIGGGVSVDVGGGGGSKRQHDFRCENRSAAWQGPRGVRGSGWWGRERGGGGSVQTYQWPVLPPRRCDSSTRSSLKTEGPAACTPDATPGPSTPPAPSLLPIARTELPRRLLPCAGSWDGGWSNKPDGNQKWPCVPLLRRPFKQGN